MGTRGEVMRINKELADMIRETAKKNEMNRNEASKEIAKLAKVNSKEVKIIREIKF